MPLTSSKPVHADYFSENLTIGAGVAIFHIQTKRVVVCYHTREKHWFLPKGRKNANESIERTAEREGYEESGYRNRLLPLPLKHRQTDPDTGHERFATEAVCIQLLPLSARSQYLLFWFIAETIPPRAEKRDSADDEAGKTTESQPRRFYRQPQPFPPTQTLQERCAEDVPVVDGILREYTPVRHEGTGVDEDELCYESFLLSIDEACRRLRGTVMEDVVLKGWEAIELRQRMEQADYTSR